jgi:hypothetical protein
MPADRRASFAGRLCIAGCVAAALMAGGCSVPNRMALFSPSAEAAMNPPVVPPVPPGVAPFDEAVALVSELKYPEAEIKFRQSLVWFQAAGDRDRSAECMFWIGFCQEKHGRTAEARGQYEKLVRDYPGTPAGRMAAERMGRLSAQEKPKSDLKAPAPPAGP